jgi:cation transport regulator ChaC
MELSKDTHLVKLELLSNATTIESALNYIRNKQQQQQQQQQQQKQQKHLSSDSTGNCGNNSSYDGQLTTTMGRQMIF